MNYCNGVGSFKLWCEKGFVVRMDVVYINCDGIIGKLWKGEGDWIYLLFDSRIWDIVSVGFFESFFIEYLVGFIFKGDVDSCSSVLLY